MNSYCCETTPDRTNMLQFSRMQNERTFYCGLNVGTFYKKYTSHFRVGHWHFIYNMFVNISKKEGGFLFKKVCFISKELFIHFICIIFRNKTLSMRKFFYINDYFLLSNIISLQPNNEIKLWLWFGNCKHRACAFNGLKFMTKNPNQLLLVLFCILLSQKCAWNFFLSVKILWIDRKECQYTIAIQSLKLRQ